MTPEDALCLAYDERVAAEEAVLDALDAFMLEPGAPDKQWNALADAHAALVEARQVHEDATVAWLNSPPHDEADAAEKARCRDERNLHDPRLN